MQPYDFLASHLATLAYQDGFDDGLEGMLAVAFTIRNRVRAGFWGGSWIDVLNNHANYSAYAVPCRSDIPDPRIYSVQQLLQSIDDIFVGRAKDTVTVAKDSVFDRFDGLSVGNTRLEVGSRPAPVLYYAQLNKITRPWFLENIARQPDKHPRVAQVGMTFFFA